MSTSIPRVPLSLAVGMVVGLASASPRVQGSGPGPTRALRAAAAAELKDFKATVKVGLAFYAGQFEILGDEVSAGTVGLEAAVPVVVDFANGAVVGLRNEADGSARSLEDFAATQAATSPLFPGSLIGDFGALDRFLAGLEAEVLKAKAKLAKTMQVFTKRVASTSGFVVNAALADAVDVAAPAPNPGSSVAPPPREMRIYALAAGSGTAVSGDGILSVGGAADLLSGPVTVTITGPGGFTTTNPSVPVNPVTGRWGTTFPASGPPNLTEGNYRVLASQGAGASVNAAIGIPGAP